MVRVIRVDVVRGVQRVDVVRVIRVDVVRVDLIRGGGGGAGEPEVTVTVAPETIFKIFQ